jgi:hypothetical protein
MDPMLAVHVAAGGTGLLSGYVALSVTKGARLHRRAGMVFVAAMLTMCAFGGIIAARTGPWVVVNTTAALLTGYLVITGLLTVRPLETRAPRVQVAGMLLALGLGAMAISFGIQAVANGGSRNGVPAFPYFLFGTVGLLGASGDWRVLRSGPRRGPSRLARHLWRMTFALWIATMSFFIGQADVFPKALRIPGLLAVPVLAVLVAMIYWLIRVRVRRRTPDLGVAAARSPAV